MRFDRFVWFSVHYLSFCGLSGSPYITRVSAVWPLCRVITCVCAVWLVCLVLRTLPEFVRKTGLSGSPFITWVCEVWQVCLVLRSLSEFLRFVWFSVHYQSFCGLTALSGYYLSLCGLTGLSGSPYITRVCAEDRFVWFSVHYLSLCRTQSLTRSPLMEGGMRMKAPMTRVWCFSWQNFRESWATLVSTVYPTNQKQEDVTGKESMSSTLFLLQRPSSWNPLIHIDCVRVEMNCAL